MQGVDLRLQVDVVLADLVAGTLYLSKGFVFDVCHGCVCLWVDGSVNCFVNVFRLAVIYALPAVSGDGAEVNDELSVLPKIELADAFVDGGHWIHGCVCIDG